MDVVGLHSCYDLQVEDTATGHGTTAQEVYPAEDGLGGVGSKWMPGIASSDEMASTASVAERGVATRRGFVTME